MYQQTLEGMEQYTETLTALQAITRERVNMQMVPGTSAEFDVLNTEAYRLMLGIQMMGDYLIRRMCGDSVDDAIGYLHDMWNQVNDQDYPNSIKDAIVKQGAMITRLYDLVEYRTDNNQPLQGYPMAVDFNADGTADIARQDNDIPL